MKGEFVKDVFSGCEKVVCHTGTIDSKHMSRIRCLHAAYVKSLQWRYILRQRDVEQQALDVIARMLKRRRIQFAFRVSEAQRLYERFAEVKTQVFFGKAAKRQRGVWSAGIFLLRVSYG